MQNPIPQLRQHPQIVATRPKRQKIVEKMLSAFAALTIVYLIWVGYIFPHYEATHGDNAALYLGLMFLFALSMMTLGATLTILAFTRRPSRGGHHG